MSLFAAAALVVLVLDPLGNIPSFTVALSCVPEARRTRVVIRELCIALALMLGFLFGGQYLFSVLGIQNEALNAAGGIMLFLIAIGMLFPSPERLQRTGNLELEPFIVPLATPLVAGPSALATLALLSGKAGTTTALLATLIAWSISLVCLLSAPKILRFIGEKGSRAVERLMGMLLVILSVQMFLNGLREFLRSLPASPLPISP
jgi:multiple antibiotic resistance protein